VYPTPIKPMCVKQFYNLAHLCTNTQTCRL